MNFETEVGEINKVVKYILTIEGDMYAPVHSVKL